MKQKRKLLAVLVAFAMLIGGIPVGVFDVHAATGHVCPAISEGVDVKVLTADTTVLERDTYYYLTNDVTLKNDIVVETPKGIGADNDPLVCLNGYNIDMGKFRFAPDVTESYETGPVTFYDCKGGNAKITGDIDASLDLALAYHLIPEYYTYIESLEMVLKASDGEVIEPSKMTRKENIWSFEFTDVELYETTPGNDSYYLCLCGGSSELDPYYSYSLEVKSSTAWTKLSDEDTIGLYVSYDSDKSRYKFENNGAKSSEYIPNKDIYIYSDDSSDYEALDTEYKVALYLNGEKINKADENDNTNEIHNFYEGGSYQFYWGNIIGGETPFYYTGGKETNYSVELNPVDNSNYAAKFVKKEYNYDDGNDGVLSYFYILKSNIEKITDVDMNTRAASGKLPGFELPNNVSNFSLKSTAWKTSGGEDIPAGTIPEGGETYYAEIVLEPNENAIFLNSTAVTVDGEEPLSHYKNTDETFTVLYEYTAPEGMIKLDAPTADLATGEYTTDKTVTLSAGLGATIYYTLDGSDPLANGTEYTGSIELVGAEGETVNKTISAIAVNAGMENSDIAVFDYTISIPNENPEVTVSVVDIASWKQLINKVTFGLFFKADKTVEVTADDSYSGIDKIYYYVSDGSDEYSNEAELETAIGTGWSEYNGTFDIEVANKVVVYAKAIDKAGNTSYACTDGIVLYEDSASVTTDLKYTKIVTLTDTIAEIELNGNTIKDVKVGDNVLSSSDYNVSADGKITFSKEYLETLAEGEHVVTVSVNPMGETFVDSDKNDKPLDISFSLKIVDAEENEDGTITDGEGNTYIPVDNDGDGKPDDYIEVTPNGDGTYEDEDGNKYIPDQDGDGVPETDKDGDGIFEGSDSDNEYIPDQDGDGKPEVDSDGDGVFEGTGSDNEYIPDQDGDGKPEVDSDGDGIYEGTADDKTYIPDQDGDSKAEPDSDGDGIFEGTADDKTYIPDQDGDGKPEVDSDGDGVFEGTADDKTYIPDQDGDGKAEPDSDGDGIYEGTADDKTYIPDQDGDGKAEPDSDGDGVFEGTKDGDTFIGVDEDQDGDIDKIVEADKNESEGTYEDEDGNIYIPADTDKDGKDDEFIEVKPNEDGSYTDGEGNTYIPVDKDSDGKTDEIIEVKPNDDGSYTDDNGTPNDPSDDKTYIPVDKDGDGKADEIIEVTPNGDGTYSDKAGNEYESNGEGVFVPVKLTGTDTGDDMNPLIWFMIMMIAAGAAVVTRRVRA